MKLRTLIETVLPTILDELDGYKDYELSLVAVKEGNTVAQSLVCIKNIDGDYVTTYSDTQVIEKP